MDVSLKLLRVEWTKNHLIAIAFGLVAFALGSVSTELWNGGDAKISGVDGVLAIDGFHFFQMLISLICWGWFAYQAWVLFPVMRIHAISLVGDVERHGMGSGVLLPDQSKFPTWP